MEPTLRSGDSVLACRVAYHLSKPKPGHIVVVRDENRRMTLIKRVSDVDAKRVFLVGDNNQKSTDSREFGWVGKDRIIGKVFYFLN